MRGSPPPPRRPGSGDWGMDPNANPNQTVGGTPYRGGPMAPGPRPKAAGPSPNSSIPRGDPARSFGGSRPHPATSMGGTASVQAMRSRAMAAAGIAELPPERLWSGNIRRLWLGEIASTAGEVVLGTGIVIWWMQLNYSLAAVALLLLSFAVPAAVVAFFSGSFASITDTRRALGLIDVLRIALALLFVLMHFETIPPVVYLLAIGLSLASSLRGALRRGAVSHGVPVRARSVLASGDQVAAGVLSVAGPALATLLYILNGERIFTISIGAAVCFALAFLNEAQAAPLPEKILYQRPSQDNPEVVSVWEDDEDGDLDSRVVKAEQKSPVWELAAPPNIKAALNDVGDGLRIVGTASHASTVFVVLALLACAGGMLAVIEPVYVWVSLRQSPFVLGLLFTMTGLGAGLASAIVVEFRRASRVFVIAGLLISGGGLIALAKVQHVSQALLTVAVLGAANVFALRGGQMTLLRHFVPTGQRAVASAFDGIRAVMSPLGMIFAVMFLESARPFSQLLPVNKLGLTNLLVCCGIAVLVGGVFATVRLVLPNATHTLDDDDDELDDLPEDEWDESGGESAQYSGYQPSYDQSGRYTAYSSAYPAYTGEYETYDDEDEPPRRRR